MREGKGGSDTRHVEWWGMEHGAGGMTHHMKSCAPTGTSLAAVDDIAYPRDTRRRCTPPLPPPLPLPLPLVLPVPSSSLHPYSAGNS